MLRHFGFTVCDLLALSPRQIPAAAPCAPVLPLPRVKIHTRGVIYGVLLWADMNTATPLGARGRSVMSLAGEGHLVAMVPVQGILALYMSPHTKHYRGRTAQVQ